jgi:hypothetical protein
LEFPLPIIPLFRAVCFAPLLLTAGCVTTGEQAAGNPDRSASASQFAAAAPKQGYGVLYVGRPMTMNTSVFAIAVELDGRPLASLGPNQFTRVELRPGSHSLGVKDDYWNGVISGRPHPAEVRIESGKTYYALPTRWAGETTTNIVIIGNSAIPTQSAVAHSSFAVQPSGTPPKDFDGLTFVTPLQ